MKIREKYVVYEENRIMDNENHWSLKEINFKGFEQPNLFDTVEEAIQALIKDDKFYKEYLILKKIYIQR